MKRLVLVVILLFISSMSIADIQFPVSGKCHVVASMAGSVQRVRIKFDINREEMLVRAKEHTPDQLQGLMFSVINMVYDFVPLSATPEAVYRSVSIDCMGTEV